MVELLFVTVVIVLMWMSMVRFVIDLMVISLFIMVIIVIVIVVEYCFIFICNDWVIVKIHRYCRLMSIKTIQYNKFPLYLKSHKTQSLT